MAEFDLSNNCFKFSEKTFQHISGTVLSTKFASPYPGISMDEVETEFLQTLRFKSLVWHIGDIFFIWTHCEEKLNSFMKDLNNFKHNPNFIFEFDRNFINFLDFFEL